MEVGDGDELHGTTEIQHIYTAHVTTFEILKFYKEGRLPMLYGNHNLQLKSVNT